ncbi:hypothetical protein GW579_15625 [Rahnella sp. Lac-M11]|jgi:hypothetical protein|uniref:Uncharacterized protein n=1 Tax=Rahnella contaminans TaxID=2703882 RepID=A0A6M2B5T7_9GAMM|nr:hypothetical protein [Rahnella contaminans]NGX88508.1 hypothetical protein [Rahnella contaminans]
MTDMDVKIVEENTVPKAINRLIKNGWTGAVASALITVALDVYFWTSGVRNLLVYFNLIYVFVTCGLAYGIYRRSRVCAVLMLLLFVLDKVYAPVTYSSGNIVFFVMFMMFFSGGVVGTFWYHSKARSQDVSSTKVLLLTALCAAVCIGFVAGVKYLMTDSPQKAWHEFHQQLDTARAKGSFPVRLDYYTVLQNAELNDKTLIYTYTIENTRLADITDAQLETQSRTNFTGAYCAGNMVKKYGLQVEYVYTQGLTEKSYSYNKNDCMN